MLLQGASPSFTMKVPLTQKEVDMAREGKGWHGNPKGHAEAAKGDKVKGSSSRKGSGWHGDSQGHAKAAKGEDVKSEGGILGKFKK
jgi:hypothetical protein